MLKHILLVMAFALVSCSSENKKPATNQEEVITVSAKPFSTDLFYTGVVQPLKTIVVTAPAEGVIQEMYFHYGDAVKAGQLLFSVSSEKFLTDYKTALIAYLKAKSEFDTAQNALKESEFLRKNELISDDEYKSKKTAFYNSQLAFIQTKDALNLMLKQLDMKDYKLTELSIQNIEKINQLLHSKENLQQLQIVAPVSGIILLPVKVGSGESDSKKSSKGDSVKQGDLLAVIGDVNGLAINISVSEFNINQLKLGQSVTVTGAAFPDFVLSGKISGIDRQGQPNSGGMPVFPIEIMVPNLTTAQQKVIHAGMSAKVEINIQGQPEITVPIAAVYSKNGNNYVNVIDPSSKKSHAVPVKTGQTNADSVVILSNLKEGDNVVFTR